jgi:hypothetical protein
MAIFNGYVSLPEVSFPRLELFQECRVAGSQFAPSIMDAAWMRTMGRNS